MKLLDRRYKETMSEDTRREVEHFMTERACPTCAGSRLRPETLSVKIAGRSIADVVRFPVKAARQFFDTLTLSEREMAIARRVLKEIRERLGFLSQVGLDYLTLDRPAATLSGGEGQRIRLATQIGSSLVGVLYILDEPSIGLHQRDNGRFSTRSSACATSATRCWWWSTTRRRCGPPTTWSISGPARASWAGTWSRWARPTR